MILRATCAALLVASIGALAGCGLCAGKKIPSGTIVFQEKFEQPLASNGWQAVAGGKMEQTITRIAQPEAPGRSCLRVTSGAAQSPAFPVEPQRYYRVRFTARAANRSLWAFYFFDDQGRPLPGDSYASLDPTPEWTSQEFFVKTKYPGVRAAIVFHCIDPGDLQVANLSIAPAGQQEAADWVAACRSRLPPVPRIAMPAAAQYLPRTLAKLRRGGDFRIVFFGDSIANDLSNSPFDLLLEKSFPKARVECRFTGRGGTGFVTHQDFVAERVSAHQPDLVVLEAVSHAAADREKLAPALQRIIDEIRAALPAAEILLVTGHLQAYMPKTIQGEEQRAIYREVAEKNDLGLVDLLSAWDQYCVASGQPLDWLMRDAVHMNPRGRLLSAMVLEQVFATDK